MGYFAAQMKAGRPLPPTPPTPYFPPSPPIQPTELFYPHFGVAMNLSKKLGLKPTIETVKRLEMAQQEMARKKSSDPRPTPRNPRKCMQNLQQPQGKPQGLEGKGKERAKDDDEVSLDDSEDELMEGYHDDKEMEEIDPLDQPGETIWRPRNSTWTVKSPIVLDSPSSGKCKLPLKELRLTAHYS